MSVARPATLALAVLALFGASGCRMAGVDNIARREPVPTRPALDARAVIAEHNRNAERIASLEAKPSLVVTSAGRRHSVNGRMALERPRNFLLNLYATMGDVADIGSNDEKFWFWVRDNPDKAFFYCNYDEAGSAPQVTAARQPDWIVEALGLRAVPEDEAGDYKLTKGDGPDDLLLTHQPTRLGDETITRVTVISAATHQIKEHRLFAGEPRVLLAKATVDGYLKLVPADRPDEMVYVPRKLKLEWVQEGLAMDVTFDDGSTFVNRPNERRKALFVEQPRKGYERRNLATLDPSPSRGPTSIRETLPAPPTGVQLGDPTPMAIEGARRTETDPIALSADLPPLPSLSNELVGPALPRAPEPEYARPAAGSGWHRRSVASFVER